MQAPERILVRAPSWLGDAVMATPALRALRAAHPAARITVSGRPLLAELLRDLPSFDAFLPDARSGAAGVAAGARALREHRFDWALLLPDSVRVALPPFLARVPRRVGYARDPIRRALLNDRLPSPPERRAVSTTERYLCITRHLGCPDRGGHLELVVDPAARQRVAQELARRGVSEDEPLMLVTPGAGFGPSKLWPPEHFARACREIRGRLGLRPVLAPAPNELAIARDIAARIGSEAVAWVDPPVDLAELKALVERARLVLTNDTGPRHVAVALSRPAVVLMGPTDPRITASNLEGQRVLREAVECSPCQLKTCPIDHRCMTRLAPERAVAAAEELLASSTE